VLTEHLFFVKAMATHDNVIFMHLTLIGITNIIVIHLTFPFKGKRQNLNPLQTQPTLNVHY